MKKQVLVIHGGDSFATYAEYLSFLLNYPIELRDLFKKNWKNHLQEKLGNEYEVIQPEMPNRRNAKCKEWKIWFEKYFPFLQDDLILVGHSMGGVFLVKYLAENNFPKKITATLLVAPPYNMDEGRALVEFVLPQSLSKFEKQAGKIIIYHSKDDDTVSFEELTKYQKALSTTEIKVFENRGHFSDEEFPEIIEDILKANR